MKTLGLIGGVGPESTIEYYRLIVKRFRERTGANGYPEMIIYSVNMTEMLSYVFGNHPDKLIGFMAERIKTLELSGADFGAIASNTPHIVFEELAERAGIPLISIVEETCREISYKGLKRVGLFGTKSTMSGGFYNQAAGKFGIEIISPDTDSQDYIHDKYMTELVFNRIIPETRQSLIEIVRELKVKRSIEGLILGGTELPLILSQFDFDDIEVFNTTAIHVESIVKRMVED